MDLVSDGIQESSTEALHRLKSSSSCVPAGGRLEKSAETQKLRKKGLDGRTGMSFLRLGGPQVLPHIPTINTSAQHRQDSRYPMEE